MNTEELNQLAQRVHKANMKWWQDPVTKEPIERNKGELLMLVITELAEACEGERKDLMDDKLPHRKMAEVEMADAYIRLLDYAAGFKVRLHKIGDCVLEPNNKGDYLYCICTYITRIKYSDSLWMSESLSFIRSYCTKFGYDLMGAFEEKMAFNATRIDHTHEARQQADGKKW